MASENDAYLAATLPPSPVQQMALPINVRSEAPALTDAEKQQRANFEVFCLNLRQERDSIMAIVRRLFPEANYQKAPDVINDHWAAARQEFLGGIPLKPRRLPFPAVWGSVRGVLDGDRQTTTRKRKRDEVYKPWTLERRQRTAARKLLERYRKQFSIGELWIDQAQADLIRDPFRFGVCPLPSEGVCNIPDPERELRRRNAIAIEVQFREQEQGLVQPINLSVAVPDRELEYALAQPIAQETDLTPLWEP